MKLGLIFSLSFVIMAFSLTTYPEPAEKIAVEIEKDDLYTPIRTAHPKPPTPPPPVINTTSEPLLDDSPDFTTEPIPEPPIDDKIVVPTTEPIDFQPTTEPVVPPPPIIDVQEEDKDIEEIFMVVEEMPRFSGCEAESTREEKRKCATSAMLKFIYSKIKYPAVAREAGIEGMVVIRFIVEKDGAVSNAEIVREIGGGCGKEAQRVVELMPNWIPGKQLNRTVRVQYNLPVKFSLQ
ncbi:MAG: TonB family protein [Bacteroidota bacterium]